MTAAAKRRESGGPALRVVGGNAAALRIAAEFRERARTVMAAMDCNAWGTARHLAGKLHGDLARLTGRGGSECEN